jgi:peptide methionine sulfoxide reductase MsrA
MRAGAFWEAEPEHQDYLEHYQPATPAISFDVTGGFQAEQRRGAG